MKQVSYSGKYSLSASRAHKSHLQFAFVVGDAFCPRFLHVTIATETRLSAQNQFFFFCFCCCFFFFCREKSTLTYGDAGKSRRSSFPCFKAI